MVVPLVEGAGIRGIVSHVVPFHVDAGNPGDPILSQHFIGVPIFGRQLTHLGIIQGGQPSLVDHGEGPSVSGLNGHGGKVEVNVIMIGRIAAFRGPFAPGIESDADVNHPRSHPIQHPGTAAGPGREHIMGTDDLGIGTDGNLGHIVVAGARLGDVVNLFGLVQKLTPQLTILSSTLHGGNLVVFDFDLDVGVGSLMIGGSGNHPCCVGIVKNDSDGIGHQMSRNNGILRFSRTKFVGNAPDVDGIGGMGALHHLPVLIGPAPTQVGPLRIGDANPTCLANHLPALAFDQFDELSRVDFPGTGQRIAGGPHHADPVIGLGTFQTGLKGTPHHQVITL